MHPIGRPGGGIGRLLRSVASRLQPARHASDGRDRRRETLCSAACLVGGLVLAGSINDDVLAEEILDEVACDFPGLQLELVRSLRGELPTRQAEIAATYIAAQLDAIGTARRG